MDPLDRKKIDEAGRVLVTSHPSPSQLEEATRLINAWRFAHEKPLSLFYAGLFKKIHAISPPNTTSSRIKRLPSIKNKLDIIKKLNLSEFQDIAGCRAVVMSIDQANELAERMRKSPGEAFTFKRENNYIQKPRESGYKSLHLIFEYADAHDPAFDGLQLELQIRTYNQHFWATSVEVAGAFLGQKLKSGQGDSEWLDFFRLASICLPDDLADLAHKENFEKFAAIQDKLSDLSALYQKLDVKRRFEAYAFGLKAIQENRVLDEHLLIHLDLEKKLVRVIGFADFAEAYDKYCQDEQRSRSNPQVNIVLVSLETFKTLYQAYPNYFLDSSGFIFRLEETLAFTSRI